MTIVLDSSQAATVPLPTRLFSARDIGELALQRVGAFAPMDGSADAVELDRALYWMELAISNLAGRKRCQWLIPGTITFALEADTVNYVLADAMGDAGPSLGVAYPISAKRIGANGAEAGVHIIRRSDYEAFPDKTTSGDPDYIYIDRRNGEDNLFTYPVKADDGNTVSLKLVVMTYPRSVIGEISEQEVSGNVEHGFDRTWQMWLALATACEIGDGPVRQLSNQKLTRLISLRDTTEAALMTFQNRENVSIELRRTRRRDW